MAGISLRSHLPGNVLGEDTPLCGHRGHRHHPADVARRPGRLQEAGLGPDDVDVVECQDTDAARELLAWAELGSLRAGRAGRRSWPTASATVGGKRPINPSGGLLSKGEPLGASALGQVVELVRQLRGSAGARQVEEARVGLAHVIGRGANACVTILVR